MSIRRIRSAEGEPVLLDDNGVQLGLWFWQAEIEGNEPDYQFVYLQTEANNSPSRKWNHLALRLDQKKMWTHAKWRYIKAKDFEF